MTRLPAKGSSWRRAASEVALGIVLAVVPLALWVAWSPAVFLIVVFSGGTCAALLIALWGRSESEHGDAVESRAVVSDQFVEEMHRLFPLTYHHSRKGKLRFRRTMEKLRRLVW